MFQFSWLRTPKQQHNYFLREQSVAPQAIPHEIEKQLADLQLVSSEQSAQNFWFDYLRTFPRLISRVVITRIITTLLILAAILISEQILDNYDNLTFSLYLLGVFAFLSFISTFIDSYGVLSNERLMSAVRIFTFKKIVHQLTVLEKNHQPTFSSGRLKTQASSDVDTIADFVAVCAWNLLPGLLALLILTPIAVYKMGLAGLLSVLVAIAVVPYAIFLSRWVEQQEDRLKSRLDGLASIVGEWVKQVRLIRYLGWQPAMADAVDSRVKDLLKESIKLQILLIITFGISFVWWMFCVVTLIFAAQYTGRDYELTELFATIWILTQICNSVRILPIVFIFHASAQACIKRVQSLMGQATQSSLLDPDDGMLTTKSTANLTAKRIIFDKVSLKLNNTLILKELTAVIDLNQTTAIVGQVGSGKTSLLKLIAGELKPSSGVISIELEDGTLTNLWSPATRTFWRSQLAYVPQESYLSNANMVENITLTDLTGSFTENEQATETDAIMRNTMQAAYFAQLEADIQQLANGYQEEVGESGVNLSGGQKQRVSLARAFYSERPVYLLDDPLSAVDKRTETALTKSLFEQATGLIMATHRLDPVEQCDVVWLMDSGHLVEQGNPHELGKTNSLWKKFNESH